MKSTFEVISRNAFFSSRFPVHLSVSVGRRNVTYLQLYRNAGAARCRCCLQKEIPTRFSCCLRPIRAESDTEFLNVWVKVNLPASSMLLRRN